MANLTASRSQKIWLTEDFTKTCDCVPANLRMSELEFIAFLFRGHTPATLRMLTRYYPFMVILLGLVDLVSRTSFLGDFCQSDTLICCFRRHFGQDLLLWCSSSPFMVLFIAFYGGQFPVLGMRPIHIWQLPIDDKYPNAAMTNG